MKDEKILQEEILSDDELEKVVGGYNGGSDDRKFFNYLFGGKIDLSSDDLLCAAWEKSGVTVKLKGKMVQVHKHLSARKNIPHYFVGGREVSRQDAIRQVLKTRGWNDVAIDCFEFEDYE